MFPIPKRKQFMLIFIQDHTIFCVINIKNLNFVTSISINRVSDCCVIGWSDQSSKMACTCRAPKHCLFCQVSHSSLPRFVFSTYHYRHHRTEIIIGKSFQCKFGGKFVVECSNYVLHNSSKFVKIRTVQRDVNKKLVTNC